MSVTSKSTTTGIGFGGLLGTVFMTLWLCHVIAWPWLWVLSLLWVLLALAGVVVAICALALGAIVLEKKG